LRYCSRPNSSKRSVNMVPNASPSGESRVK
jgi:hypothetical protein